MIFNGADKQYKAEFLNLPYHTFYKMPYVNYIELCRDFEDFKIVAEKWFNENLKTTKETIMGDIWAAYYNYCLENKVLTGLEKWLKYEANN